MSSTCRLIPSFIVGVLIGFIIVIVIATINLRNADLPTLRVDSASMNLLTVNNTELTGDWNITLSITNPNHHLRVYYNTISTELFYKDLVLNKSTLPSFIGNSTTSVINMKSYVVNNHLDSRVAKDIALSRREHGMVEFGLNVSTLIRFKIFFLRSHHLKSLKVVCYPLKFVFNTTAGGILLQGLTCTE